LEEGDHHKYPGRAKVPVEALASLAAGDCSIVAAVDAAVVEPAVVVVAAAAVDAAVAALGLVLGLGLAAAAGVVEPAAAGVAEAQELGDFVAGHHCHQTLVWEMEEG
jgi:hypothetical protein